MNQWVNIMSPRQEFDIKVFTALLWDQIIETERAYNQITAKEDTNEIFSAIHHFLIHVSNIVKILQPNYQNYQKKDIEKYNKLKKRSERLFINYPELPKINPKDIDIRNDLEHFDDRIDNWIKNSKTHNFADKNIGNIGPTQAINGLDPKDSFRWFVPEKKVIYFADDEYNLEYLFNYVQDVKKGIILK